MSKRRRTVYRADFERAASGTPIVWAVGPWDGGEFAAVREQLDSDGTWLRVPTLSAAIDALVGGESLPEVLLLAQERPGVDEQELVDRLQFAAPLVRVVVVAGTWCEGELRTGRPPAGVTRLYWHELPGWWRRGLTQRGAGLAPHWSGPNETTNPELRNTAQAAPLIRGTIAVDARDFATFEALEAALLPESWQCVWTPHGRAPVENATAGVWDGGQFDADERVALASFCRRFPGTVAPVVALVDYPRAEHLDAIRECGAAAILGKPYSVAALVDQLSQLMPVAAMFSAVSTPLDARRP